MLSTRRGVRRDIRRGANTLYAVGFLILFPLIPAIAIAVIPNQKVRGIITYFSAAVIMAASIALAVQYLLADTQMIAFKSEIVNYALFAVDLFLAGVVLWHGVRRGNALAVILALVSIAVVIVLEFCVAHTIEVEDGFYIDSFSVIMALIIGIVGSAICIYAVGYMKDFAAHHGAGDPVTGENADRRGFFFGIMFVFLSAMFLIVFSNNMMWLYTGWEITTVCSFLLIGYTRTKEAIANSFRQINMNLLGGIAFGVGLIVLGAQFETLSLAEMIETGQYALIPAGLLAFAGLTKAAQMPFQSWLLGAMVAPTPTSALLHSSTMVKAGVFILIKIAPCLTGTWSGLMIMMVGSFTFIFCAAMAISESNGKRVLAYSTISNLGLIVLCAGIGTAESIWAGIFLIIFHACTKALLFMCVGTAEHHIGSRDIEDMDNLFVKMPRLARLMVIGMFCMFVAPFGMLISKWGVLVSIADTGYSFLLVILAFGSAMTFFFWSKWIAKVSAIAGHANNDEETVNGCEWFALMLCVALVIACCIAIPVISKFVVVPYIEGIYKSFQFNMGEDNLMIMSCIVVALVVLTLGFFGRSKGRHQDIYLGGAGVDFDARTYMGSLSAPVETTERNWYLEKWFGAKVLNLPGSIACIAFICIGLLATVAMGIGMGGVL